jgi:D-alanyl-lipoteichoic acid acyltransferase DltB (MBOAT superfamily)
MLFNSYEFIFAFLPVAFLVYFYLNHLRMPLASKSWLVFSSLFFYSWWNIAYLPLILASVLFNYTITQVMGTAGDSQRKFFSRIGMLQIGLLFNVGLLIYFKYMDFFIGNINWLIKTDLPLLHLALPLAISFFTLQQIAFLVDSYEGLAKEKNFLDYAVFVTFFPQLIAGPIVHHAEMMPQFSTLRNKVINYRNIANGVLLFSIGLFKKVAVADTFAIWATEGFDKQEVLSLFEAWATSFSYTFQLYFDFSGYTDMAMGIALMFNIKLPLNFNSPLKKTGMIEFWKNWHMTLTSFITTYIYTPINRLYERLTFHKAMLATLITFLVAGLWHGASWMFVIFGALHGIGVVINHYWKKTKIKLNSFLAWFITFNFVNITFVFFRAENWQAAIKVLQGMCGFKGVAMPNILQSSLQFLIDFGIEFQPMMEAIKFSWIIFLYLFLGFITVLFCKNSVELVTDSKRSYKTVIFSSLLFFAGVLSMNKPSEFLYFNF